MARKKIEYSDTTLKNIEKYAELGLNNHQIAESIGISLTTFKRNRSLFSPYLKRGKTKLKAMVSEKLIEQAQNDNTTALIFIAKRLQLFSDSIDSKAPKTASEAVAEIAKVYNSLASGEIAETTGEKLLAALEKFIKAHEVTDLEDRITQLEERS